MFGAMTSLTGGGGMSASGGDATSGTGDFTGGDGSHQFNFVPPQYSVEAQTQRDTGMQVQTVAILGLAVVAVWLFMPKR